MENTKIFDVLVVYTESIATSSSNKSVANLNPFSFAKNREHYGVAYAYFLKTCETLGLSAAFTTTKDIIASGTCSNYWEYKDKKWSKTQRKAFSNLIFDKVSPLRKKLRHKRDILFEDENVMPFNDLRLHILFNDKLKTFLKLDKLTIPTVKITKNTIVSALLELDTLINVHKNKNDFSNSFVLKDRFGAGGIHIYKIDKNPIKQIEKILKGTPDVSFILQPFTKFDKGYTYEGEKKQADIRIIYSHGKIVQRYIRTPKKRDFRCNEHQGGKVAYIDSSKIPESVFTASNLVVNLIRGNNALFALDFIISNNGNVYFLEGNINPGIYWGLSSHEDKINTKKLIVTIVKELKRRSLINISNKVRPISAPVCFSEVFIQKPIFAV